MHRSVLFLAPLCLALGLCSTQGAPARLPHERMPAPETPTLDLTGTTWQGACYNIPCWITFEAGGKLTYRTSPNDANISPGVWRLTGTELYFEINQYSQHRGPVLGNSVEGDSSNNAGMRDRFRLQRVAPTP